MKNESGQALVLVLGFLVIGGLLIAPLLAHASAGLDAGQVHEEKMSGFYRADAGIEHGLWRLLHEEGFAQSLTPEAPSVEYSINISGTDVLVTITRLAGLGGDALSLNVDYTIPAGHQLELRVTVQEDDHVHFAYDTTAYSSWLQMPTGSGTLTYYLHNNPTPPIGDTDAQANLPMDNVQPTAEDLYNYDQNFDSNPGRRVEESIGGPDGLELKEYVNWRTAPYGSDTYFTGTVIVNLYVAPDGFNYDNEGEFTVYLRDYDPASGTYAEIASQTYLVDENQWVIPWHSTAPEGKYEIKASTDNAQLDSIAALGFGYLRILSFTNESG
jgi:hypothetical protein